MKEFICAATAGLGTFLSFVFGDWDVALQCLVIAIAIDYISGLIKAFINKELSSKIGVKGLLKKVGVLLIVALATLIDKITGESGMVRTLVIYYFVANEGLSVIENLGEAGLPIPDVIKKALKSLKNESKGKTNGKKLSRKKR
jgi:toxin secretion/phage lysis holin